MRISFQRPALPGRATRRSMALGIVLAAALAAPAFAQSFVGDWTATAHTQGGDTAEALHVVKTGAGYAVTARLVNPVAGMPEAGPATDVVLDGDHFSYKRTLTTPNGALEIIYSGDVSKDTFTGTVDLGFAKAPYTGVRVHGGD